MMTDMRTIIDLPIGQVNDLDDMCAREGISRAEGVRRAVALHVDRHAPARANQAFGLWRGRGHDGLVYQEQLRQEWADGSGAQAVPPKARTRSRRMR